MCLEPHQVSAAHLLWQNLDGTECVCANLLWANIETTLQKKLKYKWILSLTLQIEM